MLRFFELLQLIIKEARPRQWVKNFALYVALIFSGEFFIHHQFVTVTKAFIVFCFVSSFTYYINDIQDRKADRQHPQKKHRPIASGKLPLKLSLVIAVFLLLFALVWAYTLSEFFFIITISYGLLTTMYSFVLKKIAIVEAIVVAIGFVFRVMAGSFIINVPISSWLTVCTISLALLISFGRRKAEITLMGFKKAAKHRNVLKKYPKKYLEVMISSLISTTFLSYTLFTFTYDRHSGLTDIAGSFLPDTLEDPKWMMLTIPIAFYAISRYIYLIYNKRNKGRPELLITTDIPFILGVFSWLTVTFLIIYLPSGII